MSGLESLRFLVEDVMSVSCPGGGSSRRFLRLSGLDVDYEVIITEHESLF